VAPAHVAVGTGAGVPVTDDYPGNLRVVVLVANDEVMGPRLVTQCPGLPLGQASGSVCGSPREQVSAPELRAASYPMMRFPRPLPGFQ